MTTTRQALAACRTDVENIIKAMEPRGRTSQRFRLRSPKEQEQRQIEEVAGGGAERLFEVQIGNRVAGQSGFPSEWVGAATVGLAYGLPIVILYPSAPSWLEAAADDADQIAQLLRTTPTTATGVSLRVIQGLPTIDNMEAEPWFVLRLPLIALLDVQP